jgi:type IV secretory pathway VirB10-like protein
LIATLLPNQTLPRHGRRSYLSTPPAPLPSPSTASNEAHDEQQQYGTDGRVDDGTDQSGPKMDAELGQQPASDKGTQDSDDKVADESEAGPLHDLASKPAGYEANEQDDQQAFARHVHLMTSGFDRE